MSVLDTSTRELQFDPSDRRNHSPMLGDGLPRESPRSEVQANPDLASFVARYCAILRQSFGALVFTLLKLQLQQHIYCCISGLNIL